MKCVKHPDREAVGQCGNCGAYYCSECAEATKSLKKEFGTLCVDCYQKELRSTISGIEGVKSKRVRNIILSALFYIVGLIVLIIGIVNRTSANLSGVLMIIAGLILCGIYTAISGWVMASALHRAHEIRHGASYTITDSGVYRDKGTANKVLAFFLGAVLGVVITPIRIIKNIVGIKSDKQAIVHYTEIWRNLSKI